MKVLVESRFVAAPTPEVLALVPTEQERGAELDARGVRLNLFVAADLSASWQVFTIQSREDLNAVLASFPPHPYVTEQITELSETA